MMRKDDLKECLQQLFKDKDFLASCIGGSSSLSHSSNPGASRTAQSSNGSASLQQQSSALLSTLPSLKRGNKKCSSNIFYEPLGTTEDPPKKEKAFFRDLILLKRKHEDEPLTSIEKETAGSEGFVKEGFRLDRNWLSQTLESKVRDAFEEKLGLLNEVIFLKQSETGKLRPFFSDDVTAELIFQHCPKNVYIRPKYDLFPDIVSEPFKENPTIDSPDRHTFCLESDEDIFVSPVKNSRKRSTLLPNTNLESGERIVVVPGKKRRTQNTSWLNTDTVSNSATKSIVPQLPSKSSTSLPEVDIFQILDSCRQKLKQPPIHFTVSRKTVLSDLLDILESIEMNALRITFKNETGVGAGVIKDVFTIALTMLKNMDLLEGGEYIKTFKKHKPSLDEGVYEKLGQICALSMIHGGPAPSFFSMAFAKSLLGMKYEPSVDDILNENIKSEILNTLSAKTVFEANTVMASCMIFQNAGTFDQVSDLESSREKAVKDAILYMVQERIREETAAFAKGLDKHFNLLSQLKAVPHKALLLFVHAKSDYKLTAESLLGLFSTDMITERSRVYGFFVKYLQDAENQTNKDVKHTLEEILFFSCGVTSIPPLGFGTSAPKLKVANIYFPKSQICFNEVQLPNLVETYDEFIVVMDTALLTLELSG